MHTTTADAIASMADPTVPAGHAERTLPSEDFLVGGWLVQPTLGRLSRGHTTLRLRPQLMDVLVCLAASNGRTVGKQELHDAIWDDRFVTRSAISRSVAELRQALGDDARQPRIIETIPKRGYRIIVPIARSVPGQNLVVAAASDALPRSYPQRFAGFWPLVVLLAAVVTIALLLLTRFPS